MSAAAEHPHEGAGPGHVSAECRVVLEKVHSFIDHELDDATCEEVRQHLAECEPCLDEFDVEQAVKALVNRCCGGEKAPEDVTARLRARLGR